EARPHLSPVFLSWRRGDGDGGTPQRTVEARLRRRPLEHRAAAGCPRRAGEAIAHGRRPVRLAIRVVRARGPPRGAAGGGSSPPRVPAHARAGALTRRRGDAEVR